MAPTWSRTMPRSPSRTTRRLHWPTALSCGWRSTDPGRPIRSLLWSRHDAGVGHPRVRPDLAGRPLGSPPGHWSRAGGRRGHLTGRHRPRARAGGSLDHQCPVRARPGSGRRDRSPMSREPSRLTQRLESDPDSIQRDLMKLVLTLVELIRQLMEAQALRRVEQGDLSPGQVEDLGSALMRLEEAMSELRERFDLSPEDLNLDLGPLGTLVRREP